MPKKKPNTYTVEGQKKKSFEAAAGFAVDLSLQQRNNVTIVEHNPNSNKTYYISVTAEAEEAEE
jgi:hypothetical protein